MDNIETQQSSQELLSLQTAREIHWDFIYNEIQQGGSKAIVFSKLKKKGLDDKLAKELIDSVFLEIRLEIDEAERVTFGSFFPAIIGGVIAAVLCGLVWGGIAKLTGYEIGFMAILVGVVCGFAVLIFARGKQGTTFQVIAAGSAIFGILFGKYFAFYLIFKEEVIKEYGEAATELFSFFSSDMISIFIESLQDMLSLFDILWVVLAIGAAWKIPAGIKKDIGHNLK